MLKRSLTDWMSSLWVECYLMRRDFNCMQHAGCSPGPRVQRAHTVFFSLLLTLRCTCHSGPLTCADNSQRGCSCEWSMTRPGTCFHAPVHSEHTRTTACWCRKARTLVLAQQVNGKCWAVRKAACCAQGVMGHITLRWIKAKDSARE